MSRKLYIMCGVSGSGKSTFLSKYIENQENCFVISRDKIRFALLKDSDDYFKYESIVKKMFYSGITAALQMGYDVFADQTSLTIAARRKLVGNVQGFSGVNAIWIDTPLVTCIEQDSQREGRAFVGARKITTMFNSFIPPSFKEGFSQIFRYHDGVLTTEK
ncbi:MAG: ATP-binding protein [Candidatus Riflebacteria bacterium]|nr:ATP-binding protein [Candidatus Riflebacteria bacterium]